MEAFIEFPELFFGEVIRPIDSNVLYPYTLSRIYYITNYGRVFTLFRNKYFKELKNYHNTVDLSVNEPIRHMSMSIPKLELLIFKGYIPQWRDLLIIRKDGNIKNNYLENLSWYDYELAFTLFNNQLLSSYRLIDYHDRSPFDSTAFELWAPITKQVHSDVVEFMYSASTFGRVYNWYTREFQKMTCDKDGYLVVALSAGHQNKVHLRVNELVARVFMLYENWKKENLVVDHINGIRNDNRLINLRWASPKENMEYSVESGRKYKYTDAQLIEAYNISKTQEKYDDEITSKLTGIPKKLVQKVRINEGNRIHKLYEKYNLTPLVTPPQWYPRKSK